MPKVDHLLGRSSGECFVPDFVVCGEAWGCPSPALQPWCPQSGQRTLLGEGARGVFYRLTWRPVQASELRFHGGKERVPGPSRPAWDRWPLSLHPPWLRLGAQGSLEFVFSFSSSTKLSF